jgi:regulator of ribosome biosynthesis
VSFDLGHLMCNFSYESTDPSYNGNSFAENPDLFLLETAKFVAQSLVNQVFDLPSEDRNDVMGRLITLPEPTTKLPREKPLPVTKEETTWEKFAKTKGIKKQKRGKMVFDEDTQEYKRRFGYTKKGEEDGKVAADWVVETKEADWEDTEDPWSKEKRLKKERIAKNEKQQAKNLERAPGNFRAPGAIDLASAVQAAPSKRKAKKTAEKHHVELALEVSQRATASMGKFEELRFGETAAKQVRSEKRKRTAASGASEKDAAMAILNKVMGPEDERERFDYTKASNLVQKDEEESRWQNKKADLAQGGGKKKRRKKS